MLLGRTHQGTMPHGSSTVRPASKLLLLSLVPTGLPTQLPGHDRAMACLTVDTYLTWFMGPITAGARTLPSGMCEKDWQCPHAFTAQQATLLGTSMMVHLARWWTCSFCETLKFLQVQA